MLANARNWRRSALGLVLAGVAFAASADDQTVTFDLATNAASFFMETKGPTTVLLGGDDVVTFTGLSAGTYDFVLTMSGQGFNLSSATLNGVVGTLTSLGKTRFVGIEGTGTPDFKLTLVGTTVPGVYQKYSGELSVVKAIPEPETYAMILAGLVALAFKLRRIRRD